MNLYRSGNISNLALLNKAIAKGLKIAYLDIETSPYLVYTYGLKKVYISARQIKSKMKITSAVYMREGHKPLALACDWSTNAGVNDTKLLRKLILQLTKDHLIVMQNGDGYDVKVLQERLCDLNLPPINNIITLDTLKLSRSSMYKAAHSLDARSQQYGFGGKIKQDMDDCIAVVEGCIKTQIRRIKYNIKDVVDTRKVMFREFNYYNLPNKILNLLNFFIREKRDFCIKCAAKHQKKFDINDIIIKTKTGINKGTKIKYKQCLNCNYKWRGKNDNN